MTPLQEPLLDVCSEVRKTAYLTPCASEGGAEAHRAGINSAATGRVTEGGGSQKRRKVLCSFLLLPGGKELLKLIPLHIHLSQVSLRTEI